MWFACANSEPNGTCKGFVLLNGKSQNLLNKTLNEDDKIYVQNTTRMAQNNNISEETREALVKEVLRFIPNEPKRKEGFLAMLEASRGTSNTPTQDHIEPEQQPTTEFQRMIQEARGTHTPVETQTLISRQIEFETQLPIICGETCPIKRHCSSFPANEGNVCTKQTEQYKNKYFVRSVK
jgi:hypothetical protein